jgi:hypothetical protein
LVSHPACCGCGIGSRLEGLADNDKVGGLVTVRGAAASSSDTPPAEPNWLTMSWSVADGTPPVEESGKLRLVRTHILRCTVDRRLGNDNEEASMGEFCEGVLGFAFRTDTSDDVLAAFAALADSVPGDAPALPAPVEPDPYFRMPTDFAQNTSEAGIFDDDPFPGEPWRHDWAGVLGGSTGVMFVAHSRLVWSEMGRWTLSARFSVKDDANRVLRALMWLGPYIEPNGEQPLLLGYLRDEYQTRPLLIWHQHTQVLGEDLGDAGGV